MNSEIPDNGQGGGGNQRPEELLDAPEIELERAVEFVQAEDEGQGGGSNQGQGGGSNQGQGGGGSQRREVSSELFEAEQRARVADEGQGGGSNQRQQ